MTSASVLIVGAGPSGLVLAIWLKLLDPGLKFRIVSNADGPGTKSRAIVVHARTLEYYRQLGIADRVIEAGEIVESINIMQQGRRRGSLKFGEMGQGQSKFAIVLALPQDRHEKILLQRLKELQGTVEWNTTVESIHQEENHVVVRMNDEVESFQYVVGCDGAHSAVRTSTGIQMEGGTYSQRFYVADVMLAPSRTPFGLELAPGDGQITIVLPLGQKDSNQVRLLGCYQPKDKIAVGDETFEDVRDLAFSSTKLKVQHVNWFSTYAVHHLFASKFRDKRVFLVGDAAHLHSPVGGQGMNTGIGDASNLAWKLVAAVAHESNMNGHAGQESGLGRIIDDLLQTYHTERVKFAKTLVQTTDTVFHYVTQASIFGKFLRDIFFPYILPTIWMIPAVPPLLYSRTSQTAIEYRESMISAPNGGAGPLQSGDRVPFVPFDNGRDNHEPLDKPGWQIQTYELKPATQSITALQGLPVRNWPLNSVAQLRGFACDKVYLVRPDGHIGFIGDSLRDPKFEDYLVKWSISANS